LSRRRQRDRNPSVAPSPGGETDDHRRLRISSSGFESWPGCQLVVAQRSRALPSEGRGHWFESSRRGVAAIAQLEERSPGTTEVPGSAPGGGSVGVVSPLLGRYASLARGRLFRKQLHGSAVGVRHLCLPLWRSSDQVLPASPGRHRIMASPPGSQPGSRGSVPRGGTAGTNDPGSNAE
jgi:hypothetical protein